MIFILLWAPSVISKLMERDGQHERKRFKKTPAPTLICDKAKAAERARLLRSQGRSLREIGRRIRKDDFFPPRGMVWHAASVAELLAMHLSWDRLSAMRSIGRARCATQAIVFGRLHDCWLRKATSQRAGALASRHRCRVPQVG